MKRFIALLCIFSIPFIATAEKSVSGIVTDDKDSAVAGVSVYIPAFEKYDETKAGGTYILRNVGKGNVQIQFSKPGYKTITQIISPGDTELVLNMRIRRSMPEPDELTISSNSSALPDNLPYNVNSLSAGAYNRSGAVTLMQGLALLPDVENISAGNGIGKPVIRGLSFNRVAVREFGTQVEGQRWDEGHDIGISENGIDRVEIIKGPAVIEYGADAMGGVLLFVDEKPAAAGTILGNVNLGLHTNPRGMEGEAGLKGALAKGFFYSLRGGVMSHTSYIQGEDNDEVRKNTEKRKFAHNSKWRNESMKGILGLGKKWGVSKLSLSYYHQAIGTAEGEDENSIKTGSEDTEEQRSRELNAPYQDVSTTIVASENTIITRGSKVNINLAYQNNDRKEYVDPVVSTDPEAKEVAFGLKLTTISFDVKWTSNAAKKFGIVIGSQGIFQTNENNGIASLVPDAKSITDLSGYALMRYDLEKINLLAGIRYNSRSIEIESYKPDGEMKDTVNDRPEIKKKYEFAPMNGSIGFAYHPIDGITIKLNGAAGYATPDYSQLGAWGRHLVTNRFMMGDQSLGVEQHMGGDLGILWKSAQVDISLSAFYRMVSDHIHLMNTGMDTVLSTNMDSLITYDTLDVYRYVQGDASFSGGEATIHIHPAVLKWVGLRVSYAVMQGELDGGDYVPYNMANKLTSELTFRSKKLRWFYNPYLTFAVRNYAAQKNTAQFEMPTDAYTLFDVRIGMQLPFAHQLVELNLAVTNLMNTPYMSQFSLTRNIGVRDMGRSVSVKIRIPFGLKGFSR